MKIILGSRRHRFVARVSIFLIMVALIAVMAGCGGVKYDLTIASTAGGSVTTPGEGTFTCDEGEEVNLVAEADEGYRFVNWTGDVDEIAGVEDVTTTITVNDDYSITAEFVKQYDLTISSTEGGSVTTPGEGTFTYGYGTVVNLVAVAKEGYQFVNWTCGVGTIADFRAIATTIIINGDYSITANFRVPSISMVAAGEYHTVGLKSDGTVVAVGDNRGGQCDVGGWRGITQATAGDWHTVGLRSNGTVVAVGDNRWGQCDVGGWRGITQVAAGDLHTVGLKSDGTVVAVGDNRWGQCDVSGWTNITQVALFAGAWNTVGIKADGTVIAVGNNTYGQCDVGDWTGIVQVAAYAIHTVGLKYDGTVVAVGENGWGICNVGGWTCITQVATGAVHTVGLRSNGTVVAVGNNEWGKCDVSDWADIIQVAAGAWHTVGLRDDGTLVAVGNNDYGQCDLGDWTLK